MGTAGRQRACERFAWPVVIKAYEALWRGQEAERLAHIARAAGQEKRYQGPPLYPAPETSFANYPTACLTIRICCRPPPAPTAKFRYCSASTLLIIPNRRGAMIPRQFSLSSVPLRRPRRLRNWTLCFGKRTSVPGTAGQPWLGCSSTACCCQLVADLCETGRHFRSHVYYRCLARPQYLTNDHRRRVKRYWL
jgi:hypothetical protein